MFSLLQQRGLGVVDFQHKAIQIKSRKPNQFTIFNIY